MNRLTEKTIAVVGASSGIGQAAAHRLAAEGARIIAIARNPEPLERGAAGLPGEGHRVLVADAADEQSLRPLLALAREMGGLSGLVMCAGAIELRPLSVLSASDLANTLNANLTTAMIATKLACKVTSPTGLSVAWLSSAAALHGSAGFAAYAAAKGALLSAARALAIELAGRKLRLNTIIGGVVDTPLAKSWMDRLTPEQRDEIVKAHPLGLGTPEDMAGAIAFLMSDDSRWMTGSTLTVDGGFCAR